MKRVLLIILAVVTVFLVIGLSLAGMATQRSGNQYSPGPIFGFGGGGGGSAESGIAPAMEAPAPAAAPAFDAAGEFPKGADVYSSAAQAQERLVIQNADLAIVVNDPRARMAEIGRLAEDLGGFVVSSNLYQSYTGLGKEVPEATIVIRVPSERLDQALERIKEGAVKINYENRSGQDVTSIYIDLQAQLKAKQAAEQKLLEIMDDANRAEDVLSIYLQVQSIQTEIEQLKGQIKYYEEAAALSSISVRLIAEASTQPIVVGPWRPEGAAKDAVEDLIRFLQNFADFLIRFVIFTLPALILIAIPLYLAYLGGRALFRRFSRSRVVVEEKDIEQK